MFAQLCLLAAIAPFSSALLLQIPVNWKSSSPVNISWDAKPTDPVFTLQLFSANEFHDTFSLANNVQPSTRFAQFTLPVVPAGTYTLRAINIGNASQIYDETPQFQVAAAPADSSTSSSSSTTKSTSSTSSTSGTSTLTSTNTGSSSTFGNTVKPTDTSSTSDSSPTPQESDAPFNGNDSGAAGLRVGSWAAVALSAVAGAVAML